MSTANFVSAVPPPRSIQSKELIFDFTKTLRLLKLSDVFDVLGARRRYHDMLITGIKG